MNKKNDAELIDRAARGLRDLGLRVEELGEPREARGVRADAWMRIGKGRDLAGYAVEWKRAVTPATLGATVAQLRDLSTAARRRSLLVTEHVTPPVAARLRAERQQFADAAGNAFLEGPRILVYVVGRKRPNVHGAARGAAAFTTTGLKILFALMCDPELAGAPHRAVAAASGVALGAVPGVLRDLRDAGHLLVAGRARRLDANKRLLDAWALAYAQRLRPKTLVAAYEAPALADWNHWALDPKNARWGGEPAAHVLVRHLKPGVLTLYAEKLPPRLVVERRLALARPGMSAAADLRPRLEVRKPFWGKALRTDPNATTVPPVLVYADLLATGEARCLETARMIYDRFLARLLPTS